MIEFEIPFGSNLMVSSTNIIRGSGLMSISRTYRNIHDKVYLWLDNNSKSYSVYSSIGSFTLDKIWQPKRTCFMCIAFNDETEAMLFKLAWL